MSNSVDILIKADDQASKALQSVTNTMDATAGRFQQAGKKAKAATDIIGAFASITGSSELASFAGSLAGATEKMNGFAESAKNGGSSSFAFKAGLAGLVGTIAFGLGKALADVVWKTEAFNKQLETIGRESAAADERVKGLQNRLLESQKQDIELIQDPEAKAAAYKKLIGDLNRDLEVQAAKVSKSRKDVEAWANAWQITGNRKQYAKDAEDQLKADEERLNLLRDERDALNRLTSDRTANIEKIKQENAAKDKSRQYVETLRQEVQYLKATADEQRKLDAMRNATQQDQGEAYRLLAERDAIKAKQDAEKKLEQERQQAADKALQAEQQKRDEIKRQREALQDLKDSERERLELMRIEIEQGKEAARVKEFMNKGVDEKTAKEFVAEEARLEKMRSDKAKEEERRKQMNSATAATKLTATEGRLLTRGSSEDQSMVLQRQMVITLQKVEAASQQTAAASMESKKSLDKIKENTAGGVKMEIVK